MKKFAIIFSIAMLMFVIVGCADRSEPVGPSSTDGALTLISETQTPGWAEDVWIDGSRAFIADGEQGVSIYDISNPASPVFIESQPTAGSAVKVAYAPMTNLLLVNETSGQGGITYYNFSTGARINTVFDVGVDGFAFYEVSPDTIIICEVDRIEGFKVYTIFYDSQYNEWDDRSLRGVLPIGGTLRGLDFEHNVAYLANNQRGLTIVSINYTPLTNEVAVLGNVDTPGGARDVVLNAAKTHAIVADYQAGIAIVDVTDKSAPVLVSSLLAEDRIDRVIQIAAVGDTVYYIDQYTAIYAADVSNPANPVHLGKYLLSNPINMFVTPDHQVYIADEDLGMIVLGWR